MATDREYERLAKAYKLLLYCLKSMDKWDQVAELCRMHSLRSKEE